MERVIVWNSSLPHLGGNIKGGDEMTWFPELWDFLIDFFEPKSILDVGCGEGHLMKYFHDRMIDVNGIEGLKENKDNAPAEIRDKIVLHDYQNGAVHPEHVDMVISCEFVEHVETEYKDNFLLDFMEGDIIVMTHALPGQDGHHHVNCVDKNAWIWAIESLGYHLSPLTLQAYNLAVKYDKVLWKTVLIFERNVH